jgi:hypothetical protein
MKWVAVAVPLLLSACAEQGKPAAQAVYVKSRAAQDDDFERARAKCAVTPETVDRDCITKEGQRQGVHDLDDVAQAHARCVTEAYAALPFGTGSPLLPQMARDFMDNCMWAKGYMRAN